MFTKVDIRKGSTYLSVHLSANDYYSEGERVCGHWRGKLAGVFGIAGKAIQLDDEIFENLRRNLTPDGSKKLTPRHPDIRFFDFQCSAQKSVSIMAVTLGDYRLRVAHSKAFEIALGELENFAACRVRAGHYQWSDENRITGNICAAVFHHDASRALDPQIHTHTVVANATYDASSGRVLALTEREMLKAIRYAGKVYQNELARQVRALGYDILHVRKNGKIEGFELSGVSPEICRRFSKRRSHIEAGIRAFETRYGREPSSAEIHEIATSSRNAKLKEITTPEVLRTQKEQLSALEAVQLAALKEAALRKQTTIEESPSTLQAAIDHLFERKSVFQGHEVLAEALNQGLGSQELAELKKEIAACGGGLCRLAESEQKNPTLSAEFATVCGLQQEIWCKYFINHAKGKLDPLVNGFESRLVALNMAELRDDQEEAARLIYTSPDRVAAVRGVAGAGKTYMLKAVNGILDNAKVYYIAPTASAAKTLIADGLPNATTCADFLTNVSHREDLSNALVICDEAGLQSNKQGYALLQLAQKHSMRIRFVGDVRQHVSVEAGDFLRVMEAHSQLEVAEVGHIERQKHREYKNAVIHMATGHVLAGVERLEKLGWIHEGKGGYIANAARDYVRLTKNGSELYNCLAVAPTWAENHRFTEEIRKPFKSAGRLKGGIEATVHHSLKWTVQEKRTAANYQPGAIVTFNERVGEFRKGQYVEVIRAESDRVHIRANGKDTFLPLYKASSWDVADVRRIEIATGDKVLIRANAKSLGLVNGDVLTVERVHSDGTLESREGKMVPPRFKQWCHGYVVTSHKAQGATANHVIVAASMLDRKSAYVGCSRGRQQCLLHTPDKKRLFDRLPAGDRKAALDVIARHPCNVRPHSLTVRAKIWKTLQEAQTWVKLPRKILDTVRRHVAFLRVCSAHERTLIHQTNRSSTINQI